LINIVLRRREIPGAALLNLITSEQKMKKHRWLDKLKIIMIISCLFLISKIIVISSILFIETGRVEKYRWVSRTASIIIPYAFDNLYIEASSINEQNVKVYINNRFVKTLTLKQEPKFFTISEGDEAVSYLNRVEFLAEYEFSPKQEDKNGKDDRYLSWRLFNISTDGKLKSSIEKNNSLENITILKGVYGLERYYKNVFAGSEPVLEEVLSHWDASWYIGIISGGYEYDGDYTKEHNVVFPYIYPLASYAIKELFNLSPLWAGVLTNNIMFFMSLFVVYYLSGILIKDGVLSFIPVVMLAIYPYNVFLTGAFTEGTFILLSSISIVFLLHKKYLPYSIIAGLLNGTRVVGIIAPLILIYDYFIIQKNEITWKSLLKLGLLSFLSCWGLFSIMIYHKIKFNDWFLLAKCQRAWHPEGGSWSIFLEHIIAYFNNAVNFLDPKTLGATLSFFIIIFCVVYFFKKRKTLSRLEYILLLYALGFLLIIFVLFKEIPPAIGRFSLASFPVFILIGNILSNRTRIMVALFLMLFSVFELVIMTMLFSQWFCPC
jgi:hypothetical protein